MINRNALYSGLSVRLLHRRRGVKYRWTKFSYTVCLFVFIAYTTTKIVFYCRFVYNFIFVFYSFMDFSDLIVKIVKTVLKRDLK